MMLKIPNVIIGGAPKSGTSSLYNWLVAHPDICGSTIKETFYLMDQDNPLVHPQYNYHLQGITGYQRYFQHCNDACSLRIEATTHYLYQQTALDVLGGIDPLPKVIFMLRKPSARLYSAYEFTRNNLATLDKNISFTQAIDLIQNQPLSTLEKCSNPRTAANLKKAIQHSCYIEYLRKWREKFGSENMYVFLFEELKTEPRKFIQNLATKLKIDPEFYNKYDLSPRNEGLKIKNQVIHRNARKIAKKIPKSLLKNLLIDKYLGIFTSKKSKNISQEDQKTLQQLDEYFAPFNQSLAKEFNLDLSLWN
ncbi:sulfotransferase domain-containing protein [Gloeocapsa sp. PCC 73106]|uniref:sulfotransferase domain-containing protein n=1 Tax=Gloeocapsa sp. PCC 73106 TaxID=102232 RepID=UPI0002ABF54B|nr:sulfotransferase domain-containing protein [Gloeocapsa sp. PCC 73106]ELR96305.1 sulfotransferase family protein [Gloeocapsa sp. PCC 73106]